MKSHNTYRERLKGKMDKFVKDVYRVTKKFPQDEKYGTAAQLRRSALSIILNYIEGYARRRPAVKLNFFEMSYGSLKEAEYILQLSYHENYLNKQEYTSSATLADEIGAMLWTEISSLEKSLKK